MDKVELSGRGKDNEPLLARARCRLACEVVHQFKGCGELRQLPERCKLVGREWQNISDGFFETASIGATCIVDMFTGEQPPRIC